MSDLRSRGRHTRRAFLLALLAAALGSAAVASTYEPPSSNPQQMFMFQEHLYFVATDGLVGRELWRVRLPYGAAELVADVTPGPGERAMEFFYPLGDLIYFIVHDPRDGGQLWVSDGQPDGVTQRILVQSPGDPVAGFRRIVGDIDGTLLLHAGAHHGTSVTLWLSDGTPEGTRQVTYPNYDPLSTAAISFASYEGRQMFSASSARGNFLWVIDGDPDRVTPILDFDSEIWGFTVVPGLGVFFGASRDGEGNELWVTDGTLESTRRVKDIYPGAESSDPAHMVLYVEGGRPPLLVFSAMHPETGRELWQSDGTEAGTVLMQDIVPGAIGSEPYSLRGSSLGVYLLARTPETGIELWLAYPYGADPKAGLLRDIYPGINSAEPYALTPDAWGRLWFSARDGVTGEELWYADGYTREVIQLADLYPGPESSEPYGTIFTGSSIVFAATHAVYGRELWRAGPPSNPPVLVVDLFTDNSVNPSSAPDELTPLDDVFVFVADDLLHGRELWVSDGTEGGTELLMDIYPGRVSSNPEHLTRVGDHVYFSAESPDFGTELWITDGAKDGTAQQLDINPGTGNSSGPQHLTAWKGRVLFSAYRPYDGRELWSATPGEKPVRVKGIAEGEASSNPRNLVAWRDHVYFLADDGIHGEELWRTDGTEEGTVMVRDIVNSPVVPTGITRITPWEDRLLLSGATPETGHELWAIDHPGGAPRLVRDVAPPSALGVLWTADSERRATVSR